MSQSLVNRVSGRIFCLNGLGYYRDCLFCFLLLSVRIKSFILQEAEKVESEREKDEEEEKVKIDLPSDNDE